jgi:superfamily II DNA or RNA helicase
MSALSEKVLLKSDPALRPYQVKAIQNILLEQKCLTKMFCGTGKSIIIANVIKHEKKNLSVVVFPSLALIQQYWNDYVGKYFKKYKKISISSLEERGEDGEITIESITDSKKIKQFLKYSSDKIVLVTYQSFEVLLNNLNGQKIGIVCYDEAHHVTSPKYQKLVFGTPHFEKEVFFTATPKNENGITMFDRDDPSKSMCGPVAYEYTYLQALYDATGPYVNEFEICIDMYTENTNSSIYEAMSRAILTKDTSRVLSFHSGVNGESNTNVWNFVNEAEFQAAFDKVLKNEFPEKASYYQKPITFKGMDGKTPPDERKVMLKSLGETPSNEIYIISSCETIGEGVDTKKANMCVFADPKSSITKIIQNIGRVVRPNPECHVSTILIPCWVNMENYAAANGDRVKQDELIRQQMRSEKGDYASILNVLGALRQEDPELYEMCLDYSDSREDVSEAEDDDNESEADTESDSASDSDSDTEDRRQPKRIRMSIHQNDAIQMLWGVKGELDFSQKFCSVVIECEVSYGVEKWKESLTYMKKYFDDNKEFPYSTKEKKLNTWIFSQKRNYNADITKSQFIIKTPEIHILWTETINDPKYNEYLCDLLEKWKYKLAKVKVYIDANKKTPSNSDKNKEVKSFAMWIGTQKKNYDINITKSKRIMKTPEIHILWTKTMNDPKYQDYFGNLNEIWRYTLKKVKKYIDDNQRRPSQTDEDTDIKQLSHWIGTQKKNYNPDITKCKVILADEDIHLLWTETINNPKYKAHLIINKVEEWKLMLKRLKDYIFINNKTPSNGDKNKDIKSLGSWYTKQKSNYNEDIQKCKEGMKNPEIYALWTDFINEPKPKLIRKKKQTAIPIATTTAEQTTPHHFPPPSEIGQLHRTYLKMRSDTLNAKFKAEPQLWREYHATRKRNFATYDPASIPSNQIIRELEKIQTKRRKVVVDMGCGEAPIAHHFQNDNRFTFHNYDHQSGGDPLIQEVDISALPLDDASVEIGIMSLALWGTLDNCTQYIKEAYRVLESGGLFYISDSTKKWSPEPLTPENGGELLRKLLTENGFKIIDSTLGSPFCLFVCNKL